MEVKDALVDEVELVEVEVAEVLGEGGDLPEQHVEVDAVNVVDVDGVVLDDVVNVEVGNGEVDELLVKELEVLEDEMVVNDVDMKAGLVEDASG